MAVSAMCKISCGCSGPVFVASCQAGSGPVFVASCQAGSGPVFEASCQSGSPRCTTQVLPAE